MKSIANKKNRPAVQYEIGEFDEIIIKNPQPYSGMDLLELMRHGVDISKLDDEQILSKLNKLFAKSTIMARNKAR